MDCMAGSSGQSGDHGCDFHTYSSFVLKRRLASSHPTRRSTGTMAPKKPTSNSAPARSQKLRQRAMLLENKHLLDSICTALRDRPDCLPSVHTHCIKIGIIESGAAASLDSSTMTPDAKRHVNSPEKLCDAKDGGGSSTACSSPPDNAADDLSNQIPRCETSVADLKNHRLEAILAATEPRAFSGHALAACRKTGRRTNPKSVLLELLEFSTGIGGDTYIGTDGPWKLQSNLETAATKLNEVGTRRARDLALPPNWPQDGFYEVIADSDKLYINHRYMKENSRRPLPPQVLKMISQPRPARRPVELLRKMPFSSSTAAPSATSCAPSSPKCWRCSLWRA